MSDPWAGSESAHEVTREVPQEMFGGVPGEVSLEVTQDVTPMTSGVPTGGEFHRGVARVLPHPRVEGLAAPGTEPIEIRPRPVDDRLPVRERIRRLRIGSGWTGIGVLFSFVCWGIWALSSRGGDFGGLLLSFFLVLLIAAGLFTLLRLLGQAVLERLFGRRRRGALGSHLATGLFLVAAGIAYLGQTEWVVAAWVWVKHLFW